MYFINVVLYILYKCYNAQRFLYAYGYLRTDIVQSENYYEISFILYVYELSTSVEQICIPT